MYILSEVDAMEYIPEGDEIKSFKSFIDGVQISKYSDIDAFVDAIRNGGEQGCVCVEAQIVYGPISSGISGSGGLSEL